MAGPPAQTPRYLVHGRLAAGGMGEVYLGTQVSPAGRRRVAVKRLAASRQLDRAAMTRLVAEARLGFQLTHANICQVIDLVETDERAYIVMEFVRGMDLRALLRRLEADGRPLDPAFALYIAREVARALDYAHRRTDDVGRPLFLVHGDVTPPNVLLSVEGEVKLADFGIARAMGGSAPGSAVRGGTLGYMAPEVEEGAIDHRADIYSLGATLDEALGRATSALAPEVAAIVGRATAAAVQARYLSAGDMERALALELARRAPGFTPSALGHLVQACLVRAAGEPARLPDEGEDKTLFELESRIGPDLGRPGRAPRPDHERRTRTATSGIKRRRSVMVALVVVASGGAAALAAVAGGRGRDAPAAKAIARPAAAEGIARPAAAEGIARPAAAEGIARPTAPAEGIARPAGPAEGIARPVAQSVEAGRAGSSPPSRRAPRRAGGRARAEPRAAERAAAARSAYLTVNASPWGAVYIDGVQVAAETPLYRHALAPGVHRVTVFYPDLGRHSPVRTVRLAPDDHVTLGFER